MEYLSGTDIAVCRNQDGQDRVFEEADAENRPCLFIRKRRKYASVECDMLPSGCVLTPEAVGSIGEIQDKFIQEAYENPNHNDAPIWFGRGNTIISVDSLLIERAKAFAQEIEPIVTNSKIRLPTQ